MKIIAANWKMNGSVAFAENFIREINQIDVDNTVIVCPPIELIREFVGFRYHIGAQNCFYEEEGAFTGEISPKLLKEIKCKYVILGHSERRALFHETDDIICKKCAAAIKCGLIPIICIGERLEDRDNWKNVLANQLNLFLNNLSNNIIFAYEPVWCIGSGEIPNIGEIENVFEFIKNILGSSSNYLLYGGSVNAKNAPQIANCKNADGLLIGGSSLKIDEFKKIIQI
ncbi:MAG: triose-phosphate isomerase [Holosporaceae bacterium]|jgi:triosephosphate isomerase|nr:triose-phosphate isomerase [Holosporaceae bacterium]